MKKIVILGCENSHAKQFMTYIKEDRKYQDLIVLGCHSIEEAAKNDLAKAFNIKPLDSFDEAVGKVDGVIITARHGDFHLKFAKPYLTPGITAFIDKPITISEEDAIGLARLAKSNNIKLVGGSSLPYDEAVKEYKSIHAQGKTFGGFVRAPISMNNAYGGFYFYSEHLVDMVLSIFGFYPKSVIVYDFQDHISVTFKYDCFTVNGIFGKDNYTYSVGLFTKGKSISKDITITGSDQCFKDHFDDFYETLKSEINKTNYEDFIAPVFVLNAINRSLQSKREELVHKFIL